ncbi:four-carbon acid sugar kinase family protein [Kocuria sp. TGY1127_2]|uniref:four-carbon acid sugar kinase family protein n=1 Tax=Kocuria sp. TGY1127_2 TaxID=2711328 RepID=UPI0015C1B362|nr:four-carbon acid sugar kinase family protein [Kocuria sp. TGY1127_2]
MLNSPRRLLVLDDDPTGSQCVHDVPVAFEQDPGILTGSLEQPGSTCFTLTNTRALEENAAVSLNRRTLSEFLEASPQSDKTPLHVVSRSDSTLRGHVVAEPNALADVLSEHGVDVDAFLFCPAMIEAGRFTEGNVHYAKVDGAARRVEDTDFARDATFGYHHSDLTKFLEEKSDGTVQASEVLSLSLDDIRSGGREKVTEILAGASNRTWVVVNATDYSDMEVVVDAVTELEARGHHFVTRCGPSFVRPLAGQTEPRILGPSDISLSGDRQRHGLVVVGSHVGLTTQQLEEVQRRGSLTEIEIDVEQLLDPSRRDHHLNRTVQTIREGLKNNDVAVYTSRKLVSTSDPAESLDIARSVSDAVVEVVERSRDALPAWIVAKGGITSHEVAHRGLGIRLARVEGQFFPGQISLFKPEHAPENVRDCPYVVFPGNVGSRDALADVIERLQAASR